MELDQRDLLLVGEGVERAGREAGEGVVGGREDGEAGVGVVELVVYLVADLGALEEADERSVLPCLLQNERDVGRSCRSRRCRRLRKGFPGQSGKKQEGGNGTAEALHGCSVMLSYALLTAASMHGAEEGGAFYAGGGGSMGRAVGRGMASGTKLNRTLQLFCLTWLPISMCEDDMGAVILPPKASWRMMAAEEGLRPRKNHALSFWFPCLLYVAQ